MKKRYVHTAVIISALIFFLFIACVNNNGTGKSGADTAKAATKAIPKQKPGSTYQDTLTVIKPVAVFFSPDSLQLQKIKALLDTGVYKGITHEYEFQQHYTHVLIAKQWPGLKILESNHYRYISFTKKDGATQYIDLNSIGDFYGLLVFDGRKNALTVDMTNAETQISFYMK